MSPSRQEQAALASQLRADGGGGEGLSISAIAREMGISVSYASELLIDPTGERARQRKLNNKKPVKRKRKRRRKFTRPKVIEAMQEWDNLHGRPPYSNEWSSTAGLPNWVPSTRTVYNLFGQGGWNKAIEAAGFTPRPPHAPEWTMGQRGGNRPGGEAREAMSEERKALYAENPDHPMFKGLQEGWQAHQRRQPTGRAES